MNARIEEQTHGLGGTLPTGMSVGFPSLAPTGVGSGGAGGEREAGLAFSFLVIRSSFSGNLMFSVACTFSFCDLALVLRKQSSVSLIFFCL